MLHLGSGDLRHCLSVKVNSEATKYGSSLVVSLLILHNCVQYYNLALFCLTFAHAAGKCECDRDWGLRQTQV